MSRREEFAKRKRAEAQQAQQAGFWPELCRRIEAGGLIPIISNAVFVDPILDIDGDQIVGISAGEENPDERSIEEQLAEAWATVVGFPLPEQHMLPRVALYDRVVNSRDNRDAKTRYLDFLKDLLLDLAKDDPRFQNTTTVEDLREDIKHLRFSDIAVALGYHKLTHGASDPVQQLAQCKLSIYITTSYFDFLERAIMDDNRSPRTQVCFWAKAPINVDEKHKTAYDFTPTPEEPLVYHMFGLEDYPESMVLSEADYLDFLAGISQDFYQEKPMLPFYLRQALTQSSLILLGYRLQDWDWRVLFRGVVVPTTGSLRQFSLAIQLDPRKQQRIASAKQVMDFLSQYLDSSHLTVEWGSARDFVDTLWRQWQQWQR